MAVGRCIFCSAILWFLVAISCLQNTSLIGESYWDVPSVCGTAFAVFSPGLQRNVYDTARNCFQPHGRRYLSTRISRYPNSEASFTLTRLVISGDIALNPGPATSDNSSTCCSVCKKQVLVNHRAIECDICCYWCHIRCGEVLLCEYRQLQATRDFHWTCPSCISILKSMPFADVSNLESSFSSCSSHDYDSSSIHYASSKTNVLLGYDEIAQRHIKNCKIAHININSLAGFKFAEVQMWLSSALFDLLIITETKLDETFPNSQFVIQGFHLLRKDRNMHGGGVIMYIRNGIIFQRMKHLETNCIGIESIAVKFKLGRSWLTIIGIYRPPSLLKTQWKSEISNLVEASSCNGQSVFILGDFNCDLLQPEKPPKDGRDLLDILDIFNFKCLINSATRVTSSTETLLDLILTNVRQRVLTTGVVNPHVSDHFLTYGILRTSLQTPRSQKVTFRSLKHYDTEAFLNDLDMVPFRTVMNVFDDIDDKLYAYESLFYTIINQHAPIKQAHVRGGQVPYLTDEWRKAIRH